MVRVKRKNTAQQDFKRRKVKIGKKLAKADNVTNTSYKFKTIAVPLQHGVSTPQDPSADPAYVTLIDALRNIHHYATPSRKAAVLSIRDVAMRAHHVIAANLSDVIPALLEKLVDTETPVRSCTVAALEQVFETVNQSSLLPFARLMIVYVSSAMSKLQPEVRLDALAFLALLVRFAPAIVKAHFATLIGSLQQMLSVSQSTAVTRSFGGVYVPLTVLPPVNAPGAKAAQATAPAPPPKPTTTPTRWKSRKLTSLEARLCATWTFMQLMSVEGAQDAGESTDDMKDREDIDVQAVTRTSCVLLPRRWAVANVVEAAPLTLVATSKPDDRTELCANLVRCIEGLKDMWLECSPDSAHTGSQVQVGRLIMLARTVRLLLVKLHRLGVAQPPPIVSSVVTAMTKFYPFILSAPVPTPEQMTAVQNLNLAVGDCGTSKLVAPSWPNRAPDAAGADPFIITVCQQLIELLSGTGRIGRRGQEKSSEESTAPTAALFRTLRYLVSVCDQETHDQLLGAFETYYSRLDWAHAAKLDCVQFIAWRLHEPLAYAVPPTIRDEWLLSLPKLLWHLGLQQPSVSTTVLTVLLDVLRRSHNDPEQASGNRISPEFLRTLSKQFIPMFYTQTADTKTPMFGPFMQYPKTLQQLVIAILGHVNSFPSLLLRGMIVACVQPHVHAAIKVQLLEMLTRLPVDVLSWDDRRKALVNAATCKWGADPIVQQDASESESKGTDVPMQQVQLDAAATDSLCHAIFSISDTPQVVELLKTLVGGMDQVAPQVMLRIGLAALQRLPSIAGIESCLPPVLQLAITQCSTGSVDNKRVAVKHTLELLELRSELVPMLLGLHQQAGFSTALLLLLRTTQRTWDEAGQTFHSVWDDSKEQIAKVVAGIPASDPQKEQLVAEAHVFESL